MPAGQQLPTEAASPTNGQTALHDLFALTDEQILEIEPQAQDAELRHEQPQATGKSASPEVQASLPAGSPDRATQAAPNAEASQPPEWLAQRMKDPWNGEEAREFWQGIQQGQQEAAAYRTVFAKPEEARAAADRARVMDDIDRAYFGASGNSAAQTSESRTQLAATLLREDPAAFREMVFAGLRALEQSGVQTGSDAGSRTSASSTATQAQPETRTADHDARLAAYSAFEKAANEELERGVGAVIERALNQALPGRDNADGGALRGRLATSIRQDIEGALKSDRQLGEQVAQILSGKRLDNDTRAQVVRLIGERAQQLVPGAAKRVLSDWTQTTLATHRSQSGRVEDASARREVPPAGPESLRASLPASSSVDSRQDRNVNPNRGDARSRPVDYRKLSDEQILEM